jgi:enoyl-CoA hydratase/carnithine racemase
MLDIDERSGAVVVRLCHRKVDALNTELLAAITTAMREVDVAEPIVLTGTDCAFSAGVDLRRLVAQRMTWSSAGTQHAIRTCLDTLRRPATSTP